MAGDDSAGVSRQEAVHTTIPSTVTAADHRMLLTVKFHVPFKVAVKDKENSSPLCQLHREFAILYHIRGLSLVSFDDIYCVS